MPFYEYQCSKCGHITEVLQRVGENSPPACEKCGSTETYKIMSASGVQMNSSSSSSSSSFPSCPTCAGGTCSL